MKTREERENELYSNGLVDSVKSIFDGKNVNIDEEYYVLIADYIDALDDVKDLIHIDPVEIGRKLPEKVNSIKNASLGGIYGVTNDKNIQIEQSLSYEDKKLYFFHELTHALQTTNNKENENEHCAFYNGHDGMFLTEGTTQFTAEILYNVSNGTKLTLRQQQGRVRGDADRITFSPLSEYQYNSNILQLLSFAIDLPVPQILGLAYKENGRDILKNIYESKEGNQIPFDELMNDLEKIYSIDYLLISGYGKSLQTESTLNIAMQDGVTRFDANLTTYKELMNKVELALLSSYIQNHEINEISENSTAISSYLTTTQIKKKFATIMINLTQDLEENTIFNNAEVSNNYDLHEQPPKDNINRPEPKQIQYISNKYGELVAVPKDNGGKLTLKQKVALFLQKHNLFVNFSFVENFIHKQLDILPKETENVQDNSKRDAFINEITNNGKFRGLNNHRTLTRKQLKELEKRLNKINDGNDR